METMEKTKSLKRLTKKQKEFAREYIETGEKARSALKAYDTDSITVAAVIASENLNKPNVRAYIDSKAEKAAEFVYQLAESAENETVRLNASKDILDRAGFKAAEPIQESKGDTTYNFVFNSETQADVKALEEKIKARLLNPHVETN